MPNWKKVITSGSDAAFNTVIASNGFTGSLQGTASWAHSASQATTASYILSSNVYGSGGSGWIANADNATNANSATSATNATNITSPVTQELTLIGAFTNRIAYTDFDTLITNYNNEGPGYGYSGEVFISNAVDGFNIANSLTLNSLLSRYDSNSWNYVEAWKDNSKGMLGFYVEDPSTNEQGILTEGYIVLDGANITNPSIGYPLWFYQEDTINPGTPDPPPIPYRTSFYNGSSQFTIYQR